MKIQEYLNENIKEDDVSKEWKTIFIKAFYESTPEHIVYSNNIFRYVEEEEKFEKITPKELLAFLLDILNNNLEIGYKGDLLKKIVVETVLSEMKSDTIEEMISVVENYSFN